MLIVPSSPNAKLTDDEERAKDDLIGTYGCPRSSSFGPASGSAIAWSAKGVTKAAPMHQLRKSLCPKARVPSFALRVQGISPAQSLSRRRRRTP